MSLDPRGQGRPGNVTLARIKNRSAESILVTMPRDGSPMPLTTAT
jgi:hypothetical protein